MRSASKRELVGIAIVCTALASCIDDGLGYLFADFNPLATRASFIESEDGLRLQIELETFIDSDGEVLLDSALVVVNHDDVSTSVPDPDIETQGFPIHLSGQPSITLDLPSPISDITSFDAFCDVNGRSADVTLRFFATSIDPDPSQPPPVTEIVTSVPLALPGAPAPTNVFGASSVATLGTSGSPVVRNVVAGPNGSILFIVSSGDSQLSVTGYQATAESQDSIDSMGLFGYPWLASADPAVLYLAGVGDSGGMRFIRRSDDEVSEFALQHEATEPEFEVFNVVALQPTATGVRAAILSSFPLTDPVIIDPAEGTPPADKYYGSFIVEATYDGLFEPTSVVQTDREIAAWVPIADGTLEVTSELPPRSPDAALRIERLDTNGAVVWTHDEPVVGHDVDADALPDGTVLVTYELASGVVEVLRLSGVDGSELARASFAGTHPTVAAYGAEGVLLSFSGRATQEGVVAPARPVPLLLELDASMTVVRGAQLACSGSADLQRATDGSLQLVGAFGQRFTLGEEVTDVSPGSLILTKIADPL